MGTTALASVQHRYVDSDNGPLHALDFGGPGPTAVCLHGVTGAAWVWHDVARSLSDHRLVAVDMRGHGDSAWSRSKSYDTAEHVEDLALQIESLDESTVDLVGSSWGALVALTYAVQHPDKVRSLVLVDIEPSFSQADTELFPRPTTFQSFADAQAWLRESNPRAPQSALDAMTFGSMRRNKTGDVVPKHDPVFFERWPFRNDDHWPNLTKLTTRTLMIHAGFTFVNGDVMKKMSEAVVGSSLVEVAESGHVVPLDNPVALSDELRKFLDS